MSLLSHVAKGVTSFAVLGLLAGVASAQAPTPKRGGVAIMALGAEPAMLNSVITSATADATAACYVYEGLVTINTNTDQFEPVLAELWTISQDGRTYTFRLRNATWHDGKPFTSEDVRYTLEEVSPKYGTSFAALGKTVEAVRALDPHTIEIRLKEPYGPMLRTLACVGGGAIMPSHVFRGTDPRNNPAIRNAVGTGPFRLSEWVAGDHITLARYDGYWDTGKPYLDKLLIRFMPSAASRTQALLAGEIDYIPFTFFSSSDAKTVDANPRTKRELAGYPPNMLWLFFNLERKPLDDVRVRHALLTATDRNYIFNNAFFGSGRPGKAPWAKQLVWTDDPSIDYDKSHPFDPAKAAQMLDEAGYKPDANGVRIKLMVNYDPAAAERNQTAVALQAMWKRAGVELTLQPLEAAVLLPRVHQERNFDTYFDSYQSRGDPALGIARAFMASGIGVTFGNAAGYRNPELEAIFEKAVMPSDLKERAKLYSEAQRILMRDLPAITLHENRGYDAASRKLVGAWGWLGNARLGNAWLEP